MRGKLGEVGEVPGEAERWILDRDGEILLDVLQDDDEYGT